MAERGLDRQIGRATHRGSVARVESYPKDIVVWSIPDSSPGRVPVPFVFRRSGGLADPGIVEEAEALAVGTRVTIVYVPPYRSDRLPDDAQVARSATVLLIEQD